MLYSQRTPEKGQCQPPGTKKEALLIPSGMVEAPGLSAPKVILNSFFKAYFSSFIYITNAE